MRLLVSGALLALTGCGYVPGKGIVGPQGIVEQHANVGAKIVGAKQPFPAEDAPATAPQREPTIALRQGVHICATSPNVEVSFKAKGWQATARNETQLQTFSMDGQATAILDAAAGTCVVSTTQVSLPEAKRLGVVWQEAYFPEGATNVGTTECPKFVGEANAGGLSLSISGPTGTCAGSGTMVTIAVAS